MKRRQGFTLVELLVAMALIMFIMAILSQAFVAATGTFRSLKASGDMAERLRATTGLLQRDLAADHFEGKKRLSNPNFWLNGPPEQGFFQIYQATTGTLEGKDLDNIESYLTTTHTLAFSIKVRGNQMGDFLTASAPAGLLLASGSFGPGEARYQGTTAYSYQWGEVAWFLKPQTNPATGQPDTTVVDPNIAGSIPIPLYTLYRRQRLAVPDNSLVTQANPPSGIPATQLRDCLELSCWNNRGFLYFNNPIDLTVPGRRFGGSDPGAFTTIAQELGTNSNILAGSDIQLTDVVSFDVRVLPLYPIGSTPRSPDPFVTLSALAQPPLSYAYTAPAWATVGVVFDTWTSVNDGLANYSQWNVPLAAQNPKMPGTTIPFWKGTSGPIILAIQISIRIWDSKTNQTRQVTMIQAM